MRRMDVCMNDACNLLMMETHDSEDGDSGGPVYWSTTAYGLHTGKVYDPWPFDRSVFSRADFIDNALNVDILTD